MALNQFFKNDIHVAGKIKKEIIFCFTEILFLKEQNSRCQQSVSNQHSLYLAS